MLGRVVSTRSILASPRKPQFDEIALSPALSRKNIRLMLFNIEADTGAAVTGYVVPDNFSGVPSIILHSNGEDVLVRPANEIREALVSAGRHQTGACGFMVDERLVPALAKMHDLEIYDSDTKLLIYRRPKPHFLGKRVLRLETHLFPLWRFDEALKSRFQYFSRGIEKLGRETTTQLFLLNQVNSVYLSGRILYKSFRHYIDSHFETIFIMHNPYEEMAERLLVFAQIKKVGTDVLGMRDSMIMQTAIEFAQSLPIHDEKALKKALHKMPGAVANALANPVVRQLTTTTPDEMPGSGAVSTALDLLASFAIVGLRREPDTFVSAVEEYTGVEANSAPPIGKFRGVGTLARALKRSGAVNTLLEKDLELYQHLLAAFKKLA